MQGGFPSLGGSSAVVLRWLAGAAGLPAADHEQLAAVIAGMGDVNYAHELRLLWRGLDLFYAGDAAAAYEQVAGVFITDYSREGPQAVTLTLIVPAIALAAGRPAEALALARRAVENQDKPDASVFDTLALALAANGEFDAAVLSAREALALVPGDAEGSALGQRIQARLDAYQAGKMWQE